MKFLLLSALTTILFSQPAFSNPKNWISYGSIKGITEDTGGMYIYTSQDGSGSAGTGSCGGNRLYVATPDVDRLRALIYMAYAKASSLYVYTTECKSQWGTNFTRIQALYVE